MENEKMEMKLNHIYCGDAKETLKAFPDESIDLIVTDPPYQLSIIKRWGRTHQEKEKYWQKNIKSGTVKGAYARTAKGFMGKTWDVLPSVEIWKECLRLLKPGAFAFVMCTPRQDSLSQMIIRLSEAGFNMGFTSIYWTYASGFPKAENIGKSIDKKECKKQLIERLGRKPTKEEFKKEWKEFRKIVDEGYSMPDLRDVGRKSKEVIGIDKLSFGQVQNAERKNKKITISTTPQAKSLDGSYGGFQPKPAVEVIIVATKPLSEKTYVAQALKNKKGITWLDDCRIPYEQNDKPQGGFGDMGIGIGKPAEHQKYIPRKRGNLNSTSKERKYGYKECVEIGSEKGRFPANLLVSDDVLNDGRITSEPVRKEIVNKSIWGSSKKSFTGIRGYGDSGSFSRYFDLDKWWEEKMKKIFNQPCFLCGHIEEHGNYIDNDGRTYCDECLISGNYLDVPKLNIKDLPPKVQKTFPFLIVPKASKSEKNKGCEGLEAKKHPKEHFSSERLNDLRMDKKQNRNPNQNYHPTVKPIKLMSYLIILGSQPNNIVLDPFLGSGTTAVACVELNRKYIGIDIKPEYVGITNKKIKNIPPSLF